MRLLNIFIVILLAAAVLSGRAKAQDQDVLTYVPGSTAEVSQLTGDLDRAHNQPTLSLTRQRYGVAATDLGSSFEHDGRLFFLFGDTWDSPDSEDILAWTRCDDPEKIVLDFYRGADGKWLPLTVPGVEMSGMEVPSGGVDVGGRIFVVVTTDWSDDTGNMGRSVLAMSEDDGRSFKALYDLSTAKFINVSFWRSGSWLYLYGSGPYRKSDICLARMPAAKITDKSQWRFFAGLAKDGQPQWSAAESDAASLFHSGQVGEFSVTYAKPVSRFLLLYNAGNPRGITMRSAKTPWGPWSDGTVIFEPTRDGGYGHFMHIPDNIASPIHDKVNDPGHKNEWGGEYGPYTMTRFTTGHDGQCRIYYTMSTWNPYAVVIMHSDLRLVPAKALEPYRPNPVVHTAGPTDQKSLKAAARLVLARISGGDSHAIGAMVSSHGLIVLRRLLDQPAMEAERKKKARPRPASKWSYDLNLSSYGSSVWDQEEVRVAPSEIHSADFHTLIRQFQGLVKNTEDAYPASISWSNQIDDGGVDPPGPGLTGKVCAGCYWYIGLVQEQGQWRIRKLEITAR